MKRIGMLNLVALTLSTAALQAQPPAATTCSNATLKGAYGIIVGGTRPAVSVLFGLSALPGTVEQILGVVLQIFDGNGNFTQIDNVKGSLSGITFDRPGSGTYSVNADCTGVQTLNNQGIPFPIVNRIVIVDGGKEIRSVVVSPQAALITATGRKVD